MFVTHTFEFFIPTRMLSKFLYGALTRGRIFSDKNVTGCIMPTDAFISRQGGSALQHDRIH